MTCLAKIVLKSPIHFCSGNISSIHLCFDMFIRLENWCFIYSENFKELLDWIHYRCCRVHSDRVKSKHVYFSISNFNEWSLSWVGPSRKWLVNHPILVGKTSISNCFFGSTIFKEIGVLGDMWSGLLLRRFSWKVWFLWKWMKDYSRIVGICSVFYINFFFHSGVLTQSE